MITPRPTVIALFFVLFALSACDDHVVERSTQPLRGASAGETGHPDKKAPDPGSNFSFPEIIETEFIPTKQVHTAMKCRAWRITWPAYSNTYNGDFIPTILSLNNGELNSIHFLNNTDKQNTYNGTLSLYANQKVKSADTMWPDLIHAEGMFLNGIMETVVFAPGEISLDNLMYFVMESPGSFETLWPDDAAINYDLPYENGDFFYIWLSLQDLYGGVRIVSVSPRIIEVYLAVPNN